MLVTAGTAAGVRTAGAHLIRDGANVLFALADDVVARISRAGGLRGAERELRTARWLAAQGIPVVRVADLEQPILVGEHVVTWWAKLPEHRPATPAELGAVLRDLHAVPIPTDLGPANPDPFGRMVARVSAARWLGSKDRDWLGEFLAEWRHEYENLPPGRPDCVVHGDAWQGNVVVPRQGRPVLLDLDHVGLGRPEWDLVSLAVDHTDFNRVSAEEYQAFVLAYGGYDPRDWPGYRTLATVHELRWTTFVLSKGDLSPAAAREARHRLSCLRGEVARPWSWSAF
ncbi:phosphotransferase family protein [Crossiella cryophila]|uniref:Aminoglycoside phosphotransferase (APT) family kinase protein n=1 Tax=Crossiella cryophila TaxID=43355 RepID=A0A7W7FSC7_9PSEU|nr:aminoglycoside phosphotransferase family protein [Crossiella cryophila]MBB4675278.1 aminoglycoside phosphotransferase (APT) family kinase protein [Crossiella cryophila]